MKRRFAAAVLCALLAAGCGGVPEFDDPAQVIEVASGSEFDLVLHANHSTGYQWVLADSSALGPLQILETSYRSSDPDSDGASGVERWRMRAGAAGEGVVTLGYRGPGEQDPPIEMKQFRVRIQ